ncbi:hypothetical protein MRX96_021952 [Rhipicephalus microplus]
MHFVLGLCACLALLQLLHALPLENAIPPPPLQFNGEDRRGDDEADRTEPGKGLSAFREDDELEGSKLEGDDSMDDNYYKKILRKKAPRPPVRPERHEKCEDDRDCRRSPSQICIKHAGEVSGRCQCPFYRPVEATFNGVVRCVTAKDLFDECRSNEECTASNPYLECVNRLCSCQPPHVLKDHAECISDVEPGPSNSRQKTQVQQQLHQPLQSARQQAPDSQYHGYNAEAGATPRGYQAKNMLSRVNVPPMKEWVRVPKGFKG